MKVKHKFSDIKKFSEDPFQLQVKGASPKFKDLFLCFLKTQQAISEIMKQEQELIDKQKGVFDELLGKYAKGVGATTYPPQQPGGQYTTIFQHNFEPVSQYHKFRDELEASNKEHSKVYEDFCNTEFEVEVDLCSSDNLPDFQLFPLAQQAPYINFCIEPKKITDTILVKS